MILSALERAWRNDADSRLGQLVVNLLRMNTSTPQQEEGRALFNVADGELLRWLGPQSPEEERYIRDEPTRAREGWHAWDAEHRERER